MKQKAKAVRSKFYQLKQAVDKVVNINKHIQATRNLGEATGL
jgi:hypothetical protein